MKRDDAIRTYIQELKAKRSKLVSEQIEAAKAEPSDSIDRLLYGLKQRIKQLDFVIDALA